MDLREIVEHKVKQAYEKLQAPVLVEDVSLEFGALGRLPDTFIKFLLQELSFEDICSLVDGKTRNATARCVFGYYDGTQLELLKSKLGGRVAEKPSVDNGFGWDKIFIPDGNMVTRASLDEDDDRKTYLQIKPFAKLKTFLEGISDED